MKKIVLCPTKLADIERYVITELKIMNRIFLARQLLKSQPTKRVRKKATSLSTVFKTGF
jgi:hypothetical protein